MAAPRHDYALLAVRAQGVEDGAAHRFGDGPQAFRRLGQKRLQGRSDVGQAQAGQLGVETPAQIREVVRIDLGFQPEASLLHPASLRHDEENDVSDADGDDLDVAQRHPLERGVLDDGHLPGDLGQRAHGALDDVIEIDGAFEQLPHRPAFGGRQRLDGLERIDELAVSLVGRHASGRRVGPMDEAGLLQGRHVVAYRRRRDAEVVAFDDAARADGLACGHVIAHDGLEDLRAAFAAAHARLLSVGFHPHWAT